MAGVFLSLVYSVEGKAGELLRRDLLVALRSAHIATARRVAFVLSWVAAAYYPMPGSPVQGGVLRAFALRSRVSPQLRED